MVADGVGCGGAPDAADYGDAGADTLGQYRAGGRGAGAAQPRGARARPSHGDRWRAGDRRAARGLRGDAGGVGREGHDHRPLGDGRARHRGRRCRRSRTGFRPRSPSRCGRRPGAGWSATRPPPGPRSSTSSDRITWRPAISSSTPRPIRSCRSRRTRTSCRSPSCTESAQAAREIADRNQIGRVIARPFVGTPGAFRRTYNRRDFSLVPPEPTLLDRDPGRGPPGVGVGKISDIFAGRGLTESIHSEGNADGMRLTLEALAALERGLLFVNLVDFDMLYGHRNDVAGFARALAELDAWLPALEAALGPADAAFITADHGNDPTTARDRPHARAGAAARLRPGRAPGRARDAHVVLRSRPDHRRGARPPAARPGRELPRRRSPRERRARRSPCRPSSPASATAARSPTARSGRSSPARRRHDPRLPARGAAHGDRLAGDDHARARHLDRGDDRFGRSACAGRRCGAPKIDKHSTGGVGDKISLALAPLVRGGGDLRADDGGSRARPHGRHARQAGGHPRVSHRARPRRRSGGCCRAPASCSPGRARTLAPADRRLYALRDATATVESIPLIASSILSKKVAEGADGLVMDVKVGSGAFLPGRAAGPGPGPDAGRARPAPRAAGAGAAHRHGPAARRRYRQRRRGARGHRRAARRRPRRRPRADRPPRGRDAGHGRRRPRSPGRARRGDRGAIASGAGLDRLRLCVRLQGGDPRVDRRSRPPAARPPRPDDPGAARRASSPALDAGALGRAATLLGAGRLRKEDRIAPGVAILLEAKVGDPGRARRRALRGRVRRSRARAGGPAAHRGRLPPPGCRRRRPRARPLVLETLA